MKKINKLTVLDCVEDLYKDFVNSNGEVEITENIDPNLVMFMSMKMDVPFTFLLVFKDPVCPHCGEKLHRHKKEDFNLNKTVNMKKMVYKCSNSDCGSVITPQWGGFIDVGCNYTNSVKEYALDLGLICNISYERMSEIIYWAYGVKISREQLYKYRKEHFAEYTSRIREQLNAYYDECDIEFSDVLGYDEQYVKVMGEWAYKLTVLDPISGHVYDFLVATKDEFTSDLVFNFLKPIVDKYDINTIVTDGEKMYPEILEKLNVEHKLCTFHKMQNLMNKMLKKIKSLNRKINKLDDEIEENEDDIKEMKAEREGKVGKPTKEEQPIVDKRHALERETREKRGEKRKYKDELEEYNNVKDKVSLIFKSKTKQTAINRYNNLLDDLDEIPEELKGFIKNISKDFDKLLLHTKSKNIPTTNDLLELYHLTTLNRRDKKKYKTIEGVSEETELKTLRWEKRVVLNMNTF